MRSITAASLLFREFQVLEDKVLSADYAKVLKEEKQKNEVIGIEKLASRKRIIDEIIRRIDNAPSGFWEHYYHWNEDEQRLGLFYICLKAYSLVLEMHLGIGQKCFQLGEELTAFNVTMWLDGKASMDEVMSTWTEKTLYKTNTQYRAILKEAGLLKDEQVIRPTNITSGFKEYFQKIGEDWFFEAAFIDRI